MPRSHTVPLVLTPVRLSAGVLARLERRGLVRRLRPTRKIMMTRTATGAIEVLHRAPRHSGSHVLIGIGKRSTEPRLSCHDGGEEFILLNPTNLLFKQLYLIVALDRLPVFRKKCAAGKLTAADLLAIECVFNDPATCVFTMLPAAVHCEVTRPGPGQHPLFYVTEPAGLAQQRVTTPGYRISIAAPSGT
jgi:hypothetical protein